MSKPNPVVAESKRKGLYIDGAILSRASKEIPDKNIRKVVYRVLTDQEIFAVSRLLPHDTSPVGECISWPVYINAYQTKSKGIAISLCYREVVPDDMK